MTGGKGSTYQFLSGKRSHEIVDLLRRALLAKIGVRDVLREHALADRGRRSFRLLPYVLDPLSRGFSDIVSHIGLVQKKKKTQKIR